MIDTSQAAYERIEPHAPNLRDRRKNLTGQRFVRLTVLKFAGTTGPIRHRMAMWLCRCDCGAIRRGII